MIDPGVFLLSCEVDSYMKWHEPLYLPILVTFVAAVIYGLGIISEARELKRKSWKWVSLVFLGLGLTTGGRMAWCLTDTFYRSWATDYGKKMIAGHIGSFAIPFLALLAIGIHHWIRSRDPYRE